MVSRVYFIVIYSAVTKNRNLEYTTLLCRACKYDIQTNIHELHIELRNSIE